MEKAWIVIVALIVVSAVIVFARAQRKAKLATSPGPNLTPVSPDELARINTMSAADRARFEQWALENNVRLPGNKP